MIMIVNKIWEVRLDKLQEWAEKLIAEYKFGDRLPHRGPGGPGENIYTSIGMAAQEQAQGVVDNW